ncbi:MAG: hypothetical protein ABWW65_04525 [Thermoprotei archaeon]
MNYEKIVESLIEELPRKRWWPWKGERREPKIVSFEEIDNGFIIVFSARDKLFYLPLIKVEKIPRKLRERSFRIGDNYFIEAEYTPKYIELLDKSENVVVEELVSIKGKPIKVEPLSVETTNAVAEHELDTGSSVIVKSYRMLSPVGLEPRILKHLMEKGFRYIPRLYRVYRYRVSSREYYISIITEKIGGIEDGGKPFYDVIVKYLKSIEGKPKAYEASLPSLALRLANIIADMHVKLNPGISAEFFGVEEIRERDVTEWSRRMRKRADLISEKLENLIIDSSGTEKQFYEYWFSVFNKKISGVISRAETSLDVFVGTYKARIHQDLHLQQMRYIPETRDFIITDFEGEPLRSDEELVAKEPLVRDLATMATSFYYLAFMAYKDGRGIKSLHKIGVALIKQKAHFIWEWASRHSLYLVLKYSYITLPKNIGVDLFNYGDKPLTKYYHIYVPPWIVERALYEAVYELSYRPEWVVVPLTGLLNMPIPFPPSVIQPSG